MKYDASEAGQFSRLFDCMKLLLNAFEKSSLMAYYGERERRQVERGQRGSL